MKKRTDTLARRCELANPKAINHAMAIACRLIRQQWAKRPAYDPRTNATLEIRLQNRSRLYRSFRELR
jgi:hypothetical protein